MKIFFRKKTLKAYIDEYGADLSQANSDNAAKQALHYYVAFRTLSWWRKAIDEAEKSGNKYLSLAEMFLKIQKENEE